MLEKGLARGQELHAAGGPLEELRPELLLQAQDVTADRRLRQMEATRSASHMPFLGDGHEGLNLREAHAGPNTTRWGGAVGARPIPKWHWTEAA